MFQTLLEEFGAVVYAEVTTRFKSSNSLNFVRARGRNDFLVWDTPVFTSIAAYTNKPTFLFFNESRCLFTEAGMIDSQVNRCFLDMRIKMCSFIRSTGHMIILHCHITFLHISVLPESAFHCCILLHLTY